MSIHSTQDYVIRLDSTTMKHIAYLLFVTIIIGCQNTPSIVSQNEISRVSSPDSLVDAVVMEYNGGATTDFIYRVHTVPAQGSPKEDHEIFRADGIRNLAVNWDRPKLLEISYDKARIFHFSNFWQSSEVEDFSYVVEIKLTPEDSLWSLSDSDRWVNYPQN